MREINQLIHLTEEFSTLKSILKNGFYTSYTKEVFAGKEILIPMISFSNILYRDIGKNEVIDYGSYGLVFQRDYAIKKFELNPVLYLRNESLIEEAIKDNFEFSILPQTLDIVKQFYVDIKKDKITDHISFQPIPKKVEELINNMDENINDRFIKGLKEIFGKFFINSLYQILLAKPFKVLTSEGEEKIAFNEREWRKSFWDLNYISRIKPNGKLNEKFEEIVEKTKPHFKEKYILDFKVTDLEALIVTEKHQIQELQLFVENILKTKHHNIKIDTLENFKRKELNSG